MNQAAGQSQPGQPQAGQGVGAQQRPSSIPMYRPEQMRNITLLTDQEKIKYEKGLASLWRMHDSAPPGSGESNEAKKKIMDFGKMLAMKMQDRRNQVIQSRQQSSSLQQSSQQPGQQGQPVSTPGSAPGVAPNAGPSSTGPVSAQALGVPEGATSIVSQSVPVPGAVMSAGSASTVSLPGPNGSNKPGAAPARLPQHIADHLNTISFQAPSSVPEPEKQRWVHDLKIKYTRALMSMENTRQSMGKLDQTIKDRQEKGNPLSADEQKNVKEKRALWQKQYAEAQNFVSQARKQNLVTNPRPSANGTTQAAGTTDAPGSIASVGTSVGVAGAGAAASSVTAAPSHALQNSTASVNAAFEAAKNQQLAAGRVGVATGVPGQSQPVPGPPQPKPPQGTAPIAQVQPSPVAVSANQPNQPPALQPSQAQHQIPIKIEPGSQPPSLPTPINTNLASATAAGLPFSGTPTSGSARLHTPQTATPTIGTVRPLSHTAALHLANQRSASIPGSAPSASTPQQAPTPGVLGTIQHGHPQAHLSQAGTPPLPSKLPIPKVLPEKATQIPTPVASVGGLGSGRPSYSAGSGMPGGVMGQPVMAKTPAYQLEGEGERILNKKKLDELVKQVCGGTAEGQEGNLLTPEVEESVLNLADSFVDDVLHAACRNAKERGSKVLEIRDIQLVLERTYNIRIPGYSSDELRIVRKIQPSPHWITKMSAVQAAKVMPGKGDL